LVAHEIRLAVSIASSTATMEELEIINIKNKQ
jgi:hypothetical protein